MTTPTDAAPGATDPPAGTDPCPGCGAPVDPDWLTCAACGTALAVSTELPVGSSLADGRFVIGKVLGRGGFGITYECRDERLHRRVAMKELFPESAVRHGTRVLTPPAARDGFVAARTRFLREARVLARFNHPGIVRVFEVLEANGTAYLVLELLEGPTLGELLRERGVAFPQHEVLDVAARVGGALTEIHAAGLLHRDVSPSNLVVTAGHRIVLIDFGLARAYDSDHTAAMTRIVTPGYAPPEQYLTSARYGPASDVYGLAATLYRLLTTRTPPSAVDRQTGTELVPPRRLNPAVSKLVSDAVMDGLELDPAHRPQTAAAFLARLGLDAPAPARAPVADAPTAAPATAPVSAAPPTAAPPTAAAPGSTDLPGGPTEAVRPRATVPRPVPVAPAPVAPVARASRPVPDAADYLPGAIVGPARPGRWKASVPLTLPLVALVSAAPVLFAPLVAFVVLPAIATVGDLAVHRHRRSWGQASSWWERRSPAAAAVPRMARNAAVGAARSLPALILLVVLVAVWYPMHDSARLVEVADAFLRLSGLGVGALLVVPGLRGSPRFATGVAVDALHLRIDPPGRSFTREGWVLWGVALAVTAAALWFRPEVFPLAG